jgi:hypothetical protein
MFTVCLALFASLTNADPYSLSCWSVPQDDAELAVTQCLATRPVSHVCKAQSIDPSLILLAVSALPKGA